MKLAIASKLLGAFAALALVAAPAWLSAHHSSALFDPSRSVALEGVVQEFRWTNPHASIRLLAKVDDGDEVEWSVEMSSPEQLERAGWRSSTLRAGDAVTLVVHPMRDDTRSGLFVSGAGPRGPLSDAPPPAPVDVQTLSPGAVGASCPRLELTFVEPAASSDTRPVNLGQRTLFVRRPAIVTTSDISEIKLAGDDADTLIQIQYTPVAAARVLEATTNHDGVQLAFVVDDDVWLSFTWRGPYGIGPEGTQLSLRNGMAKAQNLMRSIRDCAAR